MKIYYDKLHFSLNLSLFPVVQRIYLCEVPMVRETLLIVTIKLESCLNILKPSKLTAQAFN